MNHILTRVLGDSNDRFLKYLYLYVFDDILFFDDFSIFIFSFLFYILFLFISVLL